MFEQGLVGASTRFRELDNLGSIILAVFETTGRV